MKQALISAVVAAVVCVAAFLVEDRMDDDDAMTVAAQDPVATPRPIALSYTVEPAEDSWVNGARSSGADDRLLSDASKSVCFLTKIEIQGIQSPDDMAACRVAVDAFTGFWQVTADVPEGSRSEIRCNARCLVWE